MVRYNTFHFGFWLALWFQWTWRRCTYPLVMFRMSGQPLTHLINCSKLGVHPFAPPERKSENMYTGYFIKWKMFIFINTLSYWSILYPNPDLYITIMGYFSWFWLNSKGFTCFALNFSFSIVSYWLSKLGSAHDLHFLITDSDRRWICLVTCRVWMMSSF